MGVWSLKGPGVIGTVVPEDVDCPVCGREVMVAAAAKIHEHEGQTYYLCSVECHDSFAENPEAFLVSESAALAAAARR